MTTRTWPLPDFAPARVNASSMLSAPAPQRLIVDTVGGDVTAAVKGWLVDTHARFTGTGMWIIPTQDRWAVLLANELCYTRDRGPLADVRNTFRALAPT